jgi:hypothetical protein
VSPPYVALYTSKTRLRADTRQLVEPAGLGQPAVEVVQLILGNIDLERPDLGGLVVRVGDASCYCDQLLSSVGGM